MESEVMHDFVGLLEAMNALVDVGIVNLHLLPP
jgi:hypothetical protein